MGAGGAGGGSEGCRGYVAAWGKSSPLRQEAKAVSGRPPPTQRVVSDLFLPLATVPEPRRQLQAQPRWRSAHPVHGDWDLPGSVAKQGSPGADPKRPREQSPAREPLNSNQVAQTRLLPGTSRGRNSRTPTPAHLRPQLHPTGLSNKTVRGPDPAPTGPLGRPRAPPAFPSPSPAPAGPPPGRPGGASDPSGALSPGPAGWGWETQSPVQLGPPGAQPRAGQEARGHRTPYGEAARGRGREGKIDPEQQLPSQGLSPSLPSTAPAPCPRGDGAAAAG